MHVVLQWFDPPGGPLGAALASLIQHPDRMLEESLRRFTEWIEGDLARVERAVV